MPDDRAASRERPAYGNVVQMESRSCDEMRREADRVRAVEMPVQARPFPPGALLNGITPQGNV